ncbi:MAG: hypothetical protein E5V89_01560 [Mesorhizobium sp.]|nr:MAG: hypothetical protein E5W94_18745 [Mesorhizobium sp.]TIV73185.1 MAG: hypothetical protein E5V89_01560 [Mesorhizobium sp.]
MQLPQSPIRHHFLKATVKIGHYPDGTLAVFHGPRRIARYMPDGAAIQETCAQSKPRERLRRKTEADN